MTDSLLGSGDEMFVIFYDTSRSESAGVRIRFTSIPQYWLEGCSSSLTDFPVTLPSTTDKVWRFTKTRSSLGVRVIIHCNNVEVANVLLSDSSCDDSGWSRSWNRETANIIFSNYWDKASDYYREAITGY